MPVLKVSQNELLSLGEECDRIAAEHRKNIIDTERILYQLQDAWQGEAAEVFTSKMAVLNNEIEEAAVTLEAFSEYVRSIVEHMAETEQTISASIRDIL